MAKTKFKNWGEFYLRCDYGNELLTLLHTANKAEVECLKEGLTKPRAIETKIMTAIVEKRDEHSICTFHQRYIEVKRYPESIPDVLSYMQQNTRLFARLDQAVRTLNSSNNLQEIRRCFERVSKAIGQPPRALCSKPEAISRKVRASAVPAQP